MLAITEELSYFMDMKMLSRATAEGRTDVGHKALQKLVSVYVRDDARIQARLETAEYIDEVFDHDRLLEILDDLIEGGCTYLTTTRPSLYGNDC